MAKRDIADIVLVFIGIKFIIDFFQSFARIAIMLIPLPHAETIMPAVLTALYIGLSVFCGWAFLFKREILLDMLFPVSAEPSIDLGAEAGALAGYSF